MLYETAARAAEALALDISVRIETPSARACSRRHAARDTLRSTRCSRRQAATSRRTSESTSSAASSSAAGLPLHLRAVTCLMLLYAQPLAGIVRLTVGDVVRDDGGLCIRFETPPTPGPEPFAALLEQQAANPGGDGWLFPGRDVAQPRSYTGVYNDLRDAGLPMRNARTSALRDLVLQAPAPVVADALGFHQTTTRPTTAVTPRRAFSHPAARQHSAGHASQPGGPGPGGSRGDGPARGPFSGVFRPLPDYRPDRERPGCAVCSQGRGFASGFLPTPPHDDAVALGLWLVPSTSTGLSTPRSRWSCRAY